LRLWTVHPRYLDAQGLVALWREALLAQKVLQGKTQGYRHHPQLARFRASSDPTAAIAAYLAGILADARRRGYAFDASKVSKKRLRSRMEATRGQLAYEWRHLKRKLRQRDPVRYRLQRSLGPAAHALFRIVAGKVEAWERLPGETQSSARVGM
jgi:hypothetical protein